MAQPIVYDTSSSTTFGPETAITHIAIAERFRDSWAAGLPLSTSSFLAPYAPNITWYDHFIRLRLTTPAAVEQSRQRWLNAHDDFSVDTLAIQPTPTGAVVQLIFRGVFARDILPKRIATGKRFACHVCFVLGVDRERRIERVDEYLPMDFDDGMDVEGYRVRDGGEV